MLTTLKEVLCKARDGGYAVPAFDSVEDVMVRAILETSEALRSPAIIMGLVGPDLDGNGWHYVSRLVRAVAGHHRIPVVLHLDHSTELDQIKRAVDLGFTSVMIDGSRLPFAENVKLTQAAAGIAHPHGVSVEAELGHVGGADIEATMTADSVLTDPQEVGKFVEETGVDALAISIGTAHGGHRSLPVLNFDRLREVRAATNVPLVIHGGSGTPDDQIREAVRNGITKTNIYAESRLAMFRGLQESARSHQRKDPLPRDLFGPIHAQMAAVVRQKIQLLGSQGRA
jgi:fructose-bisphosphate aldolase class II